MDYRSGCCFRGQKDGLNARLYQSDLLTANIRQVGSVNHFEWVVIVWAVPASPRAFRVIRRDAVAEERSVDLSTTPDVARVGSAPIKKIVEDEASKRRRRRKRETKSTEQVTKVGRIMFGYR